MAEVAFDILLLLFVAAFIAGFIDSIAGGGGLIAIPALLMAGLPPLETLGTAKLQALFGSGSATLAYSRRGLVDYKVILPMAGLSAAGAICGALVATILPTDVLQTALPLVLILIAIYFALKPNVGAVEQVPRMTSFAFGATLVPAIGFYDGIFGPGTGSFFMLAFVALMGAGLLKATAHTKVLNFASNLAGFLVFMVSGAVFWKIGLLMGLGQFLGAQAGSKLAMKNGAKIIRPLLVCSCIAMAVNLLLDPANPVRIMLAL